MPPAIHPTDLIEILRNKHLTPAIIFLPSRRACDEAIDSFQYRPRPISSSRSSAISGVIQKLTEEYPSITDHPLIPTVQQFGVAAHHAGHLPSWKIAIEELMRKGCLDAVFATTTLAAGVDFPARTVVITQSSIRKSRDFTELSIGEIQQIGGRGGRRGKDLVGFVIVTPSPYMDIHVIARGLTSFTEPIDSQFVISYPMVLNLLKAHSVDHIQPILEKSFAQYQLNQRAEVLEEKLDTVQTQLEPFGPRQCADWITQWQVFELAKKRRSSRRLITATDSPEVASRLPYLSPGRVISLGKVRGVVLRQYRSRGRHHAMLTLVRGHGALVECPASLVTQVYDHIFEVHETKRYPWCSSQSLALIIEELQKLPTRLRTLPIRLETDTSEHPILAETLNDEFPCPTCLSQQACRKDHAQALRLRQEHQQLTKTIQTLRSELWHRFQQHVEVLQKFGYLTLTCQLTDDGDWARLIRINHSLLITELIRMEAFSGIDPGLLTGILASIAHDDDRPGSFPRRSQTLASVLTQVRAVADSLIPYEDPPLLRSDVASLANHWVSDSTLTWESFVQRTSMAEGDVYRLLSRTIEYLSQLYSLKMTHPSLADMADQAINLIRRDVLQELP